MQVPPPSTTPTTNNTQTDAEMGLMRLVWWCAVLAGVLHGAVGQCTHGLCLADTNMRFFYEGTLPGGGAAHSTSSQQALFFFAFLGFNGTNTTADGSTFKYQCRDQRSAFADCKCELPPTGPWHACHSIDFTTSAFANGLASFSVRALAGTYQGTDFTPAIPQLASIPANFTWFIDTLAPSVTISQYADGGGPGPCVNPTTDPITFEIFSNEDSVDLQCRLSRFSKVYQDFDAAMERWSSEAVRLWLADPKHIMTPSVQYNLSEFIAILGDINGSTLVGLTDSALRSSPFSIDAKETSSVRRAAITSAIASQQGRYLPCSDSLSTVSSVYGVELSPSELDHGLKLLQVRAVDSASNVGVPAEYIWFVDLAKPAAVIDPASYPPKFTQGTQVNISIAGSELQPSDAIGISFRDHLGIYRECNHYRLRIALDSYDITPRSPPIYDNANFVDDLNSRNLVAYSYRNYKGDMSTVANDTFRRFSFSVSSIDASLNTKSDAARYSWTVDKRQPKTSITSFPLLTSPQAENITFAWTCDECGRTRAITFAYQLDGGPVLLTTSLSVTFADLADTPTPHSPTVPNSNHSFCVWATDEAGNQESARVFATNPIVSSFNCYAWRLDTQRPTAAFIQAPSARHLAEAVFDVVIVSDEAGGRFECVMTSLRPDRSTFQQTLPYRITKLAPLTALIQFPLAFGDSMPDNLYTLRVTPVDLAGNIGESIQLEWILDRAAPTVSLTPPSDHRGLHQTSRDYATFALKIDNPWYDLTPPRVFLALDCLTQIYTCGNSSTWFMHEQPRGDFVPVCADHNTPVLQQPRASEFAVIARSLELTESVALSGRSCVDLVRDEVVSPSFVLLSGPTTSLIVVGLREGRHVIRIRAQDAAGNIGSEVVYGWTVDLTPPIAYFASSFSARPALLGSTPDATFLLTASEAPVTYQCFLECSPTVLPAHLPDLNASDISGLSFSPCSFSAPGACPEVVSFKRLADGIYRFTAFAVDRAGNVQAELNLNGILSPTTLSWTFEIDRTPPSVIITASTLRHTDAITNGSGSLPKLGVTTQPYVQLTFQSRESESATFECQQCTLLANFPATDSVSPLGCSEYQPCSSGSYFYNFISPTQASVFSPSLFTGADARPCAVAYSSGCTATDVVRGPAACQLGFLDACGAILLDFVSSRSPTIDDLNCNRAQQFASDSQVVSMFLDCVNASRLVNTLNIRARDYAGNLGSSVNQSWIFDSIAPTILDLDHDLASFTVLDPSIPLRPFASSSSSTPSALGEITTTQPVVAFSFSADAAELFHDNGPVSYFCRLKCHRCAEAEAYRPCTSPASYDSTSLLSLGLTQLGFTRSTSTGTEVLRDGRYTFEVYAKDFAGNVGQPAAFSWTIDTSVPEIDFPSSYPTTSTNTNQADLNVYFVCSQAECQFQCRTDFIGSFYANGIRTANETKVLADYHACGSNPAVFTLFLTPTVQGAEADGLFLNAKRSDVLQILTTRIHADFRVLDLQVTNNATSVQLLVKVAPKAESGQTNIAISLLALRLQSISVGNGYIGVASDEFDSLGQLCSCATCATHATCTNGQGQDSNCDCVAEYAGSGTFVVSQIAYFPLQPEVVALESLMPALFAGGKQAAAYSTISVLVRGSDFGGQFGPSSVRTFYVDFVPPNTGILLGNTRDFTTLGLVTTETDGVPLNTTGLTASDRVSSTFECRLTFQSLLVSVGSKDFGCSLCSDTWKPCNNVLGIDARQDIGPGFVEYQSMLESGLYNLNVRAVDASGNSDPSPLSVQLYADTSAIETSILEMFLFGNQAHLVFVSNKLVASFRCNINQTSWFSCSSPLQVPLGVGLSTVQVVAVDAEGREDSSPACNTDHQPNQQPCYRFNVTSTGSTSASTSCGGGQNSAALAFLVLGWILFLLLLVFLVVVKLRAKREAAKTRTTIAFRNPIFDRDRSTLQISAPSNFQHVSSGLISSPSNFRHVVHQTSEMLASNREASGADEYQGNAKISNPINFRHVAHGYDEMTLADSGASAPVPLRKRVKDHALNRGFNIDDL
eukprot:m.882910 g.882910  ORF g.882910 m.882910 type:complete len:2032 (-) comp59878_c1_seq1:107-6202(-)